MRLADYPACPVQEILRGVIRGTRGPLAPVRSGGDEDGPASHRSTRLNIGRGIANHEGGSGVDVKGIDSLLERESSRLAARTAIVGVMGAVVDGVDSAMGSGQRCLHLSVNGFQVVFREEPPGNTALIGDDDDREAMVLEKRYRFRGIRENAEILRLATIGNIRRNRAVAVKKDDLLRYDSPSLPVHT